MTHDFLGHPAPAIDLSWKPRGGQWCQFDLDDVEKQAALLKQGAYGSRTGSLVAVYQGPRFSAPVIVTRADGTVEADGGPEPGVLVLVNARGTNARIVVQNKDGDPEVTDVCFFPDSPHVKNLRPVDDLRDLPPGRVGGSAAWEAIHNADKPEEHHVCLPDTFHEACGRSCTPAALLEAHAALRSAG